MDRDLFVQNIKRYCALMGKKPTVACRESGVGTSFISCYVNILQHGPHVVKFCLC